MRVLFCTELNYLGQNNILLEAYGKRDESACHEIFCGNIHKHGVDLYIQDISIHARDFTT